jgi:hypothetical protein
MANVNVDFYFIFFSLIFNPPSYLPERLQWAVGMYMKNSFPLVKNNNEKPISIDRGTQKI